MIKPEKHSAERGHARFWHYGLLNVFTLIAAVLGTSLASADDQEDGEFLKSFTMWLEIRNDDFRQIEIKPICIFLLMVVDDGNGGRERLHVHVRLMPDDSSDTDPYRIRAHAMKSYHVTAPDLSEHASLLEQGGVSIAFVAERADKQQYSSPGVVPFRRNVLRKTVLVSFW